MTKFLDKPTMAKAVTPTVKEVVTSFDTSVKPSSGTFRIQANKLTSRLETLLKIKGAFKIKLQNKGNVAITVFGNYKLESYDSETFETGDSSLGFDKDYSVEFPQESVGEKINIVITAYFK